MKKLGLILVMLILVMGFSSNAYALATISLVDPAVGMTFLIEDGGEYDADGALDGNVTYIESSTEFGGLLSTAGSVWGGINVTTGLTSLGTPGFPRLDLTNVSVSSSGEGTLTIGFSDNVFTASPAVLGWSALIGGTTAGTISYSALLDDGGLMFMGYGLGSTGPLGPGGIVGSFASSTTALTSTYSISQFVTISHVAGNQVSSFNAELTAVPEPTSLLLLGFGLLGVGFLGRRKSRK